MGQKSSHERAIRLRQAMTAPDEVRIDMIVKGIKRINVLAKCNKLRELINPKISHTNMHTNMHISYSHEHGEQLQRSRINITTILFAGTVAPGQTGSWPHASITNYRAQRPDTTNWSEGRR